MGMTNTKIFEKYRPVMESMDRLDKEDMEELKLAEEPETGIEEYYSAHTDYMDPDAKVVFIGICPGFEQMKLSFDLVREEKGKPADEVLRDAKVNARFGRSMRRNLIELADRTDLPALLKIDSTAELFDPKCRLMDNTALLPYPVFRNGKNYTGHAPKIDRSPLLHEICEKQLEKIAETYKDAVFIPLGKCVDEQVTKAGILPQGRIVHGFPHPSGANGHRFRQLEDNLASINESLKRELGDQKIG